MKKTFHSIWNVITTIVVVCAVALALLLVGVRIFGITPFSVLSGSMEPAYKTGSLIYVKKMQPADIKIGDPITFVLNEDLVVATHRVVEIDSANQYFYTKGDANEAVDGAPVHFKNLIGKPIFSIPYLGYLSNYITNSPGMYIAITVVLVFILLMFVPDLLKMAEASDKKKISSTELESATQ